MPNHPIRAEEVPADSSVEARILPAVDAFSSVVHVVHDVPAAAVLVRVLVHEWILVLSKDAATLHSESYKTATQRNPTPCMSTAQHNNK